MVATGVGATSTDIGSMVQSGQAAQNTLENNYLIKQDVKNLLEDLEYIKYGSEEEKEIYKKYAELSKE